MKTKFESLFEQTFISAHQRQPSVPSDEVDAVQPDDNSISVVELPSAKTSVSEPHVNVPGNMEEEGEENSMAKSNLFAIYSDAKELHNILQMAGLNPETWMLQKIAVCADNLSSVLKAARYDVAQQSNAGSDNDAAVMAGV